MPGQRSEAGYTVLLKETFGLIRYHTAQCKQRDHIGQGHKAVEYISNGPHGLYCHVWPDENSKDLQPAVCLDHLHVAAGEVFQAPLGIIIPAEDGGKGKEHQAEH